MHSLPKLVPLLSLLSLGVLACAAAFGEGSMARSVTIYRDSYGVPHVYGPTDASVVYGLAWAQAEDNFAHLEDNFIRSLGRAAVRMGVIQGGQG